MMTGQKSRLIESVSSFLAGKNDIFVDWSVIIFLSIGGTIVFIIKKKYTSEFSTELLFKFLKACFHHVSVRSLAPRAFPSMSD